MNELTTYRLDFGGLLPAGVASQLALGALALVGIVLLVVLYRRTLVGLPSRARRVLTGLRIAFWLVLLLFLANPTMVQRTPDDSESLRSLAVVLDRSDSMTARDNRGRSRLDDAVRAWPTLEIAAREAFSGMEFFTLGEGLNKVTDFAAAKEQDSGGASTRLHANLVQVLQRQPATGFGGLLCFTDGLDTSGQSSAALVDTALATRTPLYFVPSRNRLRPSEFLAVREADAPAVVNRNTRFKWDAVVEAFSKTDREVPVSLWQGDKMILQESLELPAGYSLIPWSRTLPADDPGSIPYEMRVGSADAEQYAGLTVKVVDQSPLPILYYQGALDWGFPFLAGILRRDPSFSLTSIFNPKIALGRGKDAPSKPNDLPSSVVELQKHQVVILANPFANQFSEEQQEALVEFVRQGGGILFISPNRNASRAFAGTKLEEILPVVFEDQPLTEVKNELSDFERMMREQREEFLADPRAGAFIASSQSVQPIPLLPFVLSGAARELPVFKGTAENPILIPQFESYSPVHTVKAGAEVLARSTPDGDGVLMAAQHFGKGLSVVLTTDSLWRWRLALPSESREPELFWQQLLLWIAPRPKISGLHFERHSDGVGVGQSVVLKLAGGESEDPPVVEVTPPDGQPAMLTPERGSAAGEWLISHVPTAPGAWAFVAREGEATARITLRAQTVQRTLETSNFPPDIDALRALAEATGGELILGDAPASWLAAGSASGGGAYTERRQPIWNHWFFLLPALGIYCAELIYRRRFKLL